MALPEKYVLRLLNLLTPEQARKLAAIRAFKGAGMDPYKQADEKIDSLIEWEGRADRREWKYFLGDDLILSDLNYVVKLVPSTVEQLENMERVISLMLRWMALNKEGKHTRQCAAHG